MATGIIEGILDGLVDASDDTDVALFWRGFKHKWVKKVHRTGKIGNWLRTEDKNAFPKDVFINHVAQAGTSSDDAEFSTVYDVVQATHTRFVPGKVVIPISMKERVNFHFKEHVSIQATESNKLHDKTKFTAIINGFNLKLKNGSQAKKLGHLDIDMANFEKSLQHIEFDISGNVMMSCASTECDLDEPVFKPNNVDYDLVIYYLLVAGEDEWANFIEHDQLVHSYDYDSRKGEVDEKLGSINGRSLSARLENGYQASALGIKRFSFDVSKSKTVTKPDIVPHLYSWKMWLQHAGNLTVSPEVNGQLFFSHSTKSWSNVGHVGHVAMKIKPVSLQFKVGLMKSCDWTATREFPNNKSNGGQHKKGKKGNIPGPGSFGCI